MRRCFPKKQIFIADKSTNLLEKYPEFLEDINLELSMGENYLNGIKEYDVIIKTPGISFKGIDITEFQDKITSQLQLLLEFVPIYTIGITGTKGKSTTTSLIYKILKEQGKDAYLLGNIGEPIFNNIEKFNKDSIAVLELSSHALQYVKNSPNIAILLNIYQEHLDFYESMEGYIQAKLNIAKYQKDEDILIYNIDNVYINRTNKPTDYEITLKSNPNKHCNTLYIEENKIYCNEKFVMDKNMSLKLKGIHNINNIMFALAVCDILKLDFDIAIDTIKNFEPLEHRMEFVGNINSVEYYNDSIATIPESTINTINALDNIDTLIVGGKDRGVDLTKLIEFLKNTEISNIICLPKTGEYIYEAMKQNKTKNTFFVQTLQEAVEIAKINTKKGKKCVLSPAASSYGYFKNFEERGKIFKKCVKENINNIQNNK